MVDGEDTMNRWRQIKTYGCSACGDTLLHDRMYAHHLFRCSARPAAIRQRWLDGGRRYEPKADRERW
jgi:hypothetical protein